VNSLEDADEWIGADGVSRVQAGHRSSTLYLCAVVQPILAPLSHQMHTVSGGGALKSAGRSRSISGPAVCFR